METSESAQITVPGRTSLFMYLLTKHKKVITLATVIETEHNWKRYIKVWTTGCAFKQIRTSLTHNTLPKYSTKQNETKVTQGGYALQRHLSFSNKLQIKWEGHIQTITQHRSVHTHVRARTHTQTHVCIIVNSSENACWRIHACTHTHTHTNLCRFKCVCIEWWTSTCACKLFRICLTTAAYPASHAAFAPHITIYYCCSI